MNVITIDYVMRGVTGTYDYPWDNWEDNLKNCLLHNGDYLNNDNINLYSLYSKYIETKDVGSNIINRYHYIENVRKCHQDFELHFRNDAYTTNKATIYTGTINSAVIMVIHINSTLETYYKIILKAFNDLAAAGYAHALND